MTSSYTVRRNNKQFEKDGNFNYSVRLLLTHNVRASRSNMEMVIAEFSE